MKRRYLHLAAAVVIATVAGGAAMAADGPWQDASECRSLLDAQRYSDALPVCTEAAGQGNAWAQFNLSMMYSQGWGVDKNEAEALKWLRAAADQRHAPAQFALSSRYAAGAGVPKDAREAVRLLTDAADQGLLMAQMLLGKAYEAGYPYLGIEKDTSTAIRWYRRAAEQCDPCHYELWRIHFFGLGVDEDRAEAARHLAKAAGGGLPKAQMQLAFRYMKGEGVPKDDVRAYMWLYLADKGGDPMAAKALPLQARELSRDQVAEAEVMAREAMDKPVNRTQLCELYQQFCDR